MRMSCGRCAAIPCLYFRFPACPVGVYDIFGNALPRLWKRTKNGEERLSIMSLLSIRFQAPWIQAPPHCCRGGIDRYFHSTIHDCFLLPFCISRFFGSNVIYINIYNYRYVSARRGKPRSAFLNAVKDLFW
ncbi:hypothetical protein DFJ77DRAFT_460100 [Powellomyces hirtus]|nr:hypothetical protein DFJ77DRAFT_460100 [Powellomyces hirtus]